jgi:hypothetical protein
VVNVGTDVTGLGCVTYHYRVLARNAAGTTPGADMSFVTEPCARGDENGDSQVTVADAFYLVNHLFAGGPAPAHLPAGDANSDGSLSVADVFFLVSYLFGGGPEPGP